jgi:hypothetical protein
MMMNVTNNNNNNNNKYNNTGGRDRQDRTGSRIVRAAPFSTRSSRNARNYAGADGGSTIATESSWFSEKNSTYSGGNLYYCALEMEGPACSSSSSVMMMQKSRLPSILKVKTLEYSVSLSYLSNSSSYYCDEAHTLQQQRDFGDEPSCRHKSAPRVAFDKVDIHYDGGSSTTTGAMNRFWDWKMAMSSHLTINLEQYEAEKKARLLQNEGSIPVNNSIIAVDRKRGFQSFMARRKPLGSCSTQQSVRFLFGSPDPSLQNTRTSNNMDQQVIH